MTRKPPTGAEAGALHALIGTSAAMRKIRDRIRQLARTYLPLLIEGETGTGKGVVARAVHHESGAKCFVDVNCGIFPRELIDSELFGHEKGAFTGAVAGRDGLIAAASGGILFLDELSDLPLAAQVKVLHVVETGDYRRVGSSSMRRASFRLLAATNQSLAALVERGLFREDLLHRFGKALIFIPPLRERCEDIPLIARMVLQQCRDRSGSGPTLLSTRAANLLMEQQWRGNVRELRAALELAAVLAGGDVVLEPEHLIESLSNRATGDPAAELGVQPLAVSTRNHDLREFDRALRQTGGNHREAARLLEISPSKYYRKLAAFRAK